MDAKKSKIYIVELPSDSEIKKTLSRIDYKDAYGAFILNSHIDVKNIARAFFISAPQWIGRLILLRDWLAGLLGLKTMDSKSGRPDFSKTEFLPGEKFGLFQIYEHHPREIIMGTDDRHLNFRVSLYITDNSGNAGKLQLVISTVVKFNNALGRFYFKIVRPFHSLIVPSMMREIVK